MFILYFKGPPLLSVKEARVNSQKPLGYLGQKMKGLSNTKSLDGDVLVDECRQVFVYKNPAGQV